MELTFFKVSSKCKKPKRRQKGLRFVPSLGNFVEQRGTPLKTPQYDTRYRRACHQKPGVKIMGIKLTATQQVDVALNLKDKKGNPATADGPVEFTTDNSDMVALTPNADGKTCSVVAVGPMGSCKVFATADADLGTGVKPIIGFIDVEVTAGEAAVVELTAGTPTEQPE